MRTILHCDCNSFFASVETALNPAYRDVPMAVCGSTEDRHGIVLAKNERAKKFGIKTAETVFSAKKKCPELVIASPHYDEYVRYSEAVNAIYARYTDLIEPFGIDESWLDVTASRLLFGSGFDIAEKIQRDVREELNITVSVGVSFNKVFAKLGSDYKKPDATTVISEDNFRQFVYPLPVEDLLFVGKKTADELGRMGVRTIGDLAAVSEKMLVSRFGKAGEALYSYANGLDEAPVMPPSGELQKSISNGFTFRHDLCNPDECRTGIYYLSEQLGARLRRQGQLCRTVQLAIKDSFLRVIQRQSPIDPPTDVGGEIAACARSLLAKSWQCGKPIRMLTVTVSNLMLKSELSEQIDLLSPNGDAYHKKSEKKEIAMDIIRQKYGAMAINRGSIMNTDIGIEGAGIRNALKSAKDKKADNQET